MDAGANYLSTHPEGVTLTIRIKTRSSKRGPLSFDRNAPDALKWGVSAPPVEGKANAELIESVSKRLNVARSQIELLVGKTNKNKVLLIRGLTLNEVNQRLERA